MCACAACMNVRDRKQFGTNYCHCQLVLMAWHANCRTDSIARDVSYWQLQQGFIESDQQRWQLRCPIMEHLSMGVQPDILYIQADSVSTCRMSAACHADWIELKQQQQHQLRSII
eukprot:TRINITY_DN707_c1_g1_i1.p3 TRINITY_DN707_c1_g1~~TRINITY_DN707_c1_g1_i1.p3  ORF type:complete len:115 (-),score=6.37 TRINITY_DN707_c1_g1_i1:1251-1595(-)